MAVLNSLKEIRNERNLQQYDLAVAIGSSNRTISRIERGDRNVSVEYALRLARYLNLSVEQIFSLDDDEIESE